MESISKSNSQALGSRALSNQLSMATPQPSGSDCVFRVGRNSSSKSGSNQCRLLSVSLWKRLIFKNLAALSFIGLPTDIHWEIFSHLDPVTAACLGLTCKSLWEIHWRSNGAVKLWKISERGEQTFGRPLYELLKTWVPPTLAYGEGFYFGKFVPVEKYKKAKYKHHWEITGYLAVTSEKKTGRVALGNSHWIASPEPYDLPVQEGDLEVREGDLERLLQERI